MPAVRATAASNAPGCTSPTNPLTCPNPSDVASAAFTVPRSCLMNHAPSVAVIVLIACLARPVSRLAVARHDSV